MVQGGIDFSSSLKRWFFRLLTLACLILIGISLRRWGAREIRTDVGVQLFLTLFGGAWIALSKYLFSWMGLSVRDDGIERNTMGATIALSGALLAVTFIYIGGSAGEGPSYSNNVFSIGLGAISFFGLWLMLELACDVSKSITLERDVASGLRHFGFLLSVGLIIARAIAGDWHSVVETVRDFHKDATITLLFLCLATMLELTLRPSRKRPFPGIILCGVLPTILYLGLTFLWLANLGPWEGMKR
jgi:uncharacterized membrane protein YjfL (UPF0719 family)